jgi:hypothetical protein
VVHLRVRGRGPTRDVRRGGRPDQRGAVDATARTAPPRGRRTARSRA